jgi:hypothetical protein
MASRSSDDGQRDVAISAAAREAVATVMIQ